MKKVKSLEGTVQVLNDRVGRQEKEIVALKSIVSRHQEKREVKPLSTCTTGLPCASDTETVGNSASTVATITMPANCEDLKSMGHTLNGFYMVQGNRGKITLSSQVETIFCDFGKTHPSGNQAGIETFHHF